MRWTPSLIDLMGLGAACVLLVAALLSVDLSPSAREKLGLFALTPVVGAMAGWLVVRLGWGPAIARLIEGRDALLDRLIPDRRPPLTLGLFHTDEETVTSEPIRPGDRPVGGTRPI